MVSLRSLDKNPHKTPAGHCVADERSVLTGGWVSSLAKDGRGIKCRHDG